MSRSLLCCSLSLATGRDWQRGHPLTGEMGISCDRHLAVSLPRAGIDLSLLNLRLKEIVSPFHRGRFLTIDKNDNSGVARMAEVGSYPRG